ncbi:MAG: NUDIX hydrolase [Candidatus Micrarchaeia archaeon]
MIITSPLYSKLTIPGGHIMDGENAWQAARCEVFEETGIDLILDLKYVGEFNIIIGKKDYNVKAFFAYVVVDNLVPEEDTEIKLIYRMLSGKPTISIVG